VYLIVVSIVDQNKKQNQFFFKFKKSTREI
jgi:hypothetical protein